LINTRTISTTVTDLATNGHTTINLSGEEANAAGDWLNRAINLKRKLPGRGQNQSAWRPILSSLNFLQNGQHKSCSLSSAGLGDGD